jgi:hypothetical protein
MGMEEFVMFAIFFVFFVPIFLMWFKCNVISKDEQTYQRTDTLEGSEEF